MNKRLLLTGLLSLVFVGKIVGMKKFTRVYVHHASPTTFPVKVTLDNGIDIIFSSLKDNNQSVATVIEQLKIAFQIYTKLENSLTQIVLAKSAKKPHSFDPDVTLLNEVLSLNKGVLLFTGQTKKPFTDKYAIIDYDLNGRK